MDRQLIDYYPQYLKEYKDIQCIMTAEQPEFELLWTSIEDIMNDQFIMHATINGIRRLESIYGITPKGDATLDERRNELIARICERIPFTLRTLRLQLATICGDGEFTLLHDNKTYEIIVKVHLPAKAQLLTVAEALERIVPQNMIIDLDIRRNQHGDLGRFTHKDLSHYTHLGLREEVLRHAEAD